VPNRISLTGHTDTTPFRAGRLHQLGAVGRSRQRRARARSSGGLEQAKVARVVGLASSVLFDKAEARNPINRRISIIVMTKRAEAGLFLAPQIIERCLFRPVEFARGLRRATLVTSGFVHADLPHLLFNMLTFWFFGPPLERRIGTPMFVLLYAAGLLVSQYGSYRKQRHNPQYATLGASGAISAVLFANIVYWPTKR
jgi:hypothetical protein